MNSLYLLVWEFCLFRYSRLLRWCSWSVNETTMITRKHMLEIAIRPITSSNGNASVAPAGGPIGDLPPTSFIAFRISMSKLIIMSTHETTSTTSTTVTVPYETDMLTWSSSSSHHRQAVAKLVAPMNGIPYLSYSRR